MSMPTFTIYTVQSGDTLGDIAARTGVNVAALARLNGLRDPDRLYPGQRLRVPVVAEPSAPSARPPREGWYTVQPGDTLGDIAFRYGTTVPVLVRLNGLSDPDRLRVGQRLRLPQPARPPREGWYTVQPGDTLYSIAQEQGTTAEELIRQNGITTPNLIFPGEQLRLP